MTREEALKEFVGYQTYDIPPSVEATKMAIEALKQEPCEDAISRQVAIEAVKQAIYNHDSAIMRLADLPSVTSQPKTGHWIDSSNGWMCSECNKDNTFDTNYCPNCGCRIESESDKSADTFEKLLNSGFYETFDSGFYEEERNK